MAQQPVKSMNFNKRAPEPLQGRRKKKFRNKRTNDGRGFIIT